MGKYPQLSLPSLVKFILHVAFALTDIISYTIESSSASAMVAKRTAFGIAKLPEEYKKVSVELDTVAVREALKQGIDLDFARLGEAGTHIRIK